MKKGSVIKTSDSIESLKLLAWIVCVASSLQLILANHSHDGVWSKLMSTDGKYRTSRSLIRFARFDVTSKFLDEEILLHHFTFILLSLLLSFFFFPNIRISFTTFAHPMRVFTKNAHDRNSRLTIHRVRNDWARSLISLLKPTISS